METHSQHVISRLGEAEALGDEKRTIAYLNRHNLVAIVIFTLILVSGFLWAEVVGSFLSYYVFQVDDCTHKMKPWQWLVSAIVFTIFTYIIIHRVFRVPITAAYSL